MACCWYRQYGDSLCLCGCCIINIFFKHIDFDFWLISWPAMSLKNDIACLPSSRNKGKAKCSNILHLKKGGKYDNVHVCTKCALLLCKNVTLLFWIEIINVRILFRLLFSLLTQICRLFFCNKSDDVFCSLYRFRSFSWSASSQRSTKTRGTYYMCA